MFNGKGSVLAGCGALVLLLGNQLIAADWSSLEVTRSAVQTERQTIVAKFMDLNESQGHAFWPVYRGYRSAVARTEDRKKVS